ncbi:MAG TPA: ATP-binding protein [Candidatus Accumulibacter phosphatis]|nr:MAG: hypothetical protein AW07_04700 [Candidatus Accumulibacter sp. SK-11]HAY27908.1 ATP-binding protein [Accumulibacter sp.]HCN66717.1 ATP-binding protein [Accumulibacter sp.]HRL74745.1 ATP-binding protein [Candidatus Accumulibacter phosphatis]HRQ95150.1 ATP-binding protein [Candidatus Accumulibacter phosphatis]
MHNIAGSPVEGHDFFGREAVVARLQDILDNDDILLLGPRRIGKTSAARAVMKQVRAAGWRAIEINVASCVDESGFLDKLEAALQPEVSSLTARSAGAIGDALAAIGRRIKSVKIPLPGAGSFGVELGEGSAEDWTQVGGDVLQLIAQMEERWLIYVDELPILLFNMIRNDPLTGVQRVRRFLDRIPLSEDDAGSIVTAVQWPQPYYLQATFHHLRSLIGANPGASAASLIEQAMDKLVQPGADNDFHHWQGRLSQQLSRADADHAQAMLNLAARDPSGARPESLLAALEERMGEATTEQARRTFIRLRDILQRDAYWWPDEGSGAKRYRFRLEPLRRWWLRRDTL